MTFSPTVMSPRGSGKAPSTLLPPVLTRLIRFTEGDRVKTCFGTGIFRTKIKFDLRCWPMYAHLDGTRGANGRPVYIVDMDIGGVLYSQIPKPLSTDQILAEFNGRITYQQAQALSAAGENAYLTVRAYCEKNAASLSSIASTFNYSADYTSALGSFVNPEFNDAAAKVRQAGERELQKLMELSELVKKRVETKFTTNAELVENKGKKLINDFAAKDMALACIDPLEMMERVENLLPQVTQQAAVFINESEVMLAKFQASKQGRTILAKAKALAQVTDENPTMLREKVAEAVSKLKVNDLAKWGRTLAVDAAARQEFVDQVKDRCLDFLMSVLPSIEVDPIIGTKDDVEYSLSQLDLSKFKVRKEKVSVKLGKVALADGTWQPTLAISSIEIEIKEDLTLKINGSWFSSVYNILASLFKDLIKDYIASTLEGSLIDHVVSLVTVLNTFMMDYWPMLLQLLNVTVDQLPVASAWRGAKPLLPPMPNEEDLTFTSTDLPIVLAKRTRDRMALVSGVTLPNIKTSPLTDAQRHELYRIPLQSTIVGINGLSCAKLTSKEVQKLLKSLPVPLTLRFATAVPDDEFQIKPRRTLRTFDVSFGEGPLGLKLRARPLAKHGVIVAGFIPDRTAMCNEPLPAVGQGEASGQIRPGHLLLRANGIDVRTMEFSAVLNTLKSLPRPAVLTFSTSPDGIVSLKSWPPLVDLDHRDAPDGSSYVVVKGFSRLPSFAKNSKLIAEDDQVVAVNGSSVTSLPYDKVMDLLRQAMASPPYRDHGVYVKKFVAGLGPAERSGLVYRGCAILQVCGKNVDGLDVDAVQAMIDQAQPPYHLTVRDLDMENTLLAML
ncbi:hypothetical protein DYB32_006586 [Aphanomyces invadans]|uniref:PDZ domain-containing protein n=1 Tax=Aphanomyces invadans TaxID=157072 RepID=A0A418ARZ0_9STRA|nr:hypothetical protein DYB32_006586 [Aphanomyces invadans]